MKKTLIFLLAAVLVFSVVACGKKEEKKDDKTPTTQEEASTDNTQTEVPEELKEKDLSEMEEWEVFLYDYEKFANDYILIRDEFRKVPTDMVMLGKYNEMKDKAKDWETQYEDWTVTLDGTDAAETFESEYARITATYAEE